MLRGISVRADCTPRPRSGRGRREAPGEGVCHAPRTLSRVARATRPLPQAGEVYDEPRLVATNGCAVEGPVEDFRPARVGPGRCVELAMTIGTHRIVTPPAVAPRSVAGGRRSVPAPDRSPA